MDPPLRATTPVGPEASLKNTALLELPAQLRKLIQVS
jgi:hypothetical protein